MKESCLIDDTPIQICKCIDGMLDGLRWWKDHHHNHRHHHHQLVMVIFGWERVQWSTTITIEKKGDVIKRDHLAMANEATYPNEVRPINTKKREASTILIEGLRARASLSNTQTARLGNSTHTHTHTHTHNTTPPRSRRVLLTTL